MEVLTLKWNNYQNVFSYHISELRRKAFYTDATIACNGKFYNVHKFVLSICSDYFNSIFIQTSCKNPVIIIKDVHCKDIEYLLDYMYTGEVNVRQSELASLIISAENLQIKGLAVSDKSYIPCGKIKDNSENIVNPNNFEIGNSENKPFVLKNNEISSNSNSDIFERENFTEGHLANVGIDLRECRSLQKQPDLSKKNSHPENFNNIRLDNVANEIPSRYEGEESLVHDKIKTEVLDMPLPEASLCQSGYSNYSKEVVSTNFFFQNSSDIFNQKELISNNIVEDVLNSKDRSLEKHRLSKQDGPESAFYFIGRSINQKLGNSHQSLCLEKASDNPGKKDYKCSYCGRAFSFKTNQLAHERIHTGEKPFQCLYCPLRTSLKGNLKNHILTRHSIDWKSIKHLIFPL